MSSVVLVGPLDTKGEEYAFVRERVELHGCQVSLVDCGVLGSPTIAADVTREEVAAAAGVSLADLVRAGDRGAAVAAMARGAAAVARQLHAEGRLDAALAVGGSNTAVMFAAVAATLPFGVPKLLVATVAAGDTRPYVGTTDLALLYPVVDINGLNRMSREVLANAAAAAAGMATRPSLDVSENRPVAAITVFGVTTTAATAIRHQLEEHAYEVVTFAGNGTGGRTLEALIGAGIIDLVVDLTTTELADDLLGGVCSAGPDRLTAAAEHGVPQVVVPGAMDMVNFGPPETVPAAFRDRTLHAHNRNVTLLRTNTAECAELGRRMAAKLNRARGPVSVLVPQRGFSQISVAGQPFHDPVADAAFVTALEQDLRADIELRLLDTHVNDPSFAESVTTQALLLGKNTIRSDNI